MIKKIPSEDFIEELLSHLVETNNKVPKMKQVFANLDKKEVATKNETMEGLVQGAVVKDMETKGTTSSECN